MDCRENRFVYYVVRGNRFAYYVVRSSIGKGELIQGSDDDHSMGLTGCGSEGMFMMNADLQTAGEGLRSDIVLATLSDPCMERRGGEST